MGLFTCKQLRLPNNVDEWGRVLQLLESDEFLDLAEKEDWKIAVTGGSYKALNAALRRNPIVRRMYRLAPSALGVIQVANLVVYGRVDAVFFFNDMEDIYADSPQNLCLRRLCNQLHTPLCEDFTSIEFVLKGWSSGRRPQIRSSRKLPDPTEYFGNDEVLLRERLEGSTREDRSVETLAIVSHNEKKMTMLNFCLRHLDEILSYRRVLTTGTTGKRLRDQCISALRVMGGSGFRPGWDRHANESEEDFVHRKIHPFESGPDGGDIQISAKVIDGTCHRILFFQDPRSAHAHQFDIRLMEKAVQDQDTVALFATSEEMARLIV